VDFRARRQSGSPQPPHHASYHDLFDPHEVAGRSTSGCKILNLFRSRQMTPSFPRSPSLSRAAIVVRKAREERAHQGDVRT